MMPPAAEIVHDGNAVLEARVGMHVEVVHDGRSYPADGFSGAVSSLDVSVICTSGGIAPSPDWYPLGADLDSLLHVVPQKSHAMERTTILTWLYLRKGSATFEDLAELAGDGLNPNHQKRLARAALRGLLSFGAIAIVPLGADIKSALEMYAARDEVPSEGTRINLGTAAYITSRGMTWMRRAWEARRSTVGKRPSNLLRVHRMYLVEEEEGRRDEPFWLETLGSRNDDSKSSVRREAEAGWVHGPISSVFDLSRAMSAR